MLISLYLRKQKLNIMDTKKTILISIATTLATLFIVATTLHILRGNCGKRSNCNSMMKAHCGYMKSHCDKSSSCASYSSCSKKKCSKSSSCSEKSKCAEGKKCSSKTTCTKGENGEQIIKKVVKVEDEK